MRTKDFKTNSFFSNNNKNHDIDYNKEEQQYTNEFLKDKRKSISKNTSYKKAILGLLFKKGGWIQKAIKKPGALTLAAKREGKSISEFCRKKNLSLTNKRRCNLAKTLKSFNRK